MDCNKYDLFRALGFHSGGYEELSSGICHTLFILLGVFFDPEDGSNMFL
jgi:hypothetical protein